MTTSKTPLTREDLIEALQMFGSQLHDEMHDMEQRLMDYTKRTVEETVGRSSSELLQNIAEPMSTKVDNHEVRLGKVEATLAA